MSTKMLFSIRQLGKAINLNYNDWVRGSTVAYQS